MEPNITCLDVFYNDQVVGRLKLLEDHKISFQYHKQWISSGFSISPFSLPLNDTIYINDKKTFDGLYGVFYDSLPSAVGQKIARQYFMKQGIKYDQLSILTKLSLSHSNSFGGLSYKPAVIKNDISNGTYNLDDIYQMMKLFIENKEQDEDFINYLYSTCSCSDNEILAQHHFEKDEYIVTLLTNNYRDEEYQLYCLAQNCGINVSEYRLFPSELNQNYFGRKHFDRRNNQRVHVITFSSLLETPTQIPNLDYLYLAKAIKEIDVDYQQDLKEAYRRMVFNVLLPNREDDAKGFSFVYDEEKKGYILSPMYNIKRTEEIKEHKMMINGKRNPNEDDLLNVSSYFSLHKNEAKEMIEKIRAKITEFKSDFLCEK